MLCLLAEVDLLLPVLRHGARALAGKCIGSTVPSGRVGLVVASSHPCCRPLWHLLLAFPPSPPQVVVYIYFTRIIVYLLESTLPFQLIWLAAAASEAATLAFYVAAGVSFR